MKNFLLTLLILGTTTTHATENQHLNQLKRKKSKEYALIKAIGGSYIAAHRFNLFLNLLFQPYLITQETKDLIECSLKIQTRISCILFIIGACIAKSGFNDLDEIAQEE